MKKTVIKIKIHDIILLKTHMPTPSKGQNMKRKILLCTVAIFTITSSLPAIAADMIKSPVKAVTLSSGGLAEIQRATTMDGDGEIKIEVPLDQVNDILKSLVVFDPSGTVKDLSLAGPSPVEETFRNMPFTPNDLTSLPSLLTSLRGAEIHIKGKVTGTGKILGVEQTTGKDNEHITIVNLLGKNGQIQRFKLDPMTTVNFIDTTIQEKIATALGVIGNNSSDTSRNIVVKINGAGEREVDFSYVIAAPIWKTAYRVVVGKKGKARLQAWAILENATGEDWENVEIVLNSSSPVTLTQKLHDRYWKKRNELPITVDNVGLPPADQGNIAMSRKSTGGRGDFEVNFLDMPSIASAPESMMMQSADSGPRSEMSYAQNAQSSEGDLSASFTLDGLYDIRNGDTVSVPIVDQEVTAELISLFRPDRGNRHPIAAVSMDNTTGVSLPGGILTVYDQNGAYIGDSNLLGLPSGDTRMSSFALDKKVTVDTNLVSNNKYTEIKVVNGIMTARSIYSEKTVYSVKGALDGERTVIIEHPKRNGWDFKSSDLESQSSTDYRLKVELGDGQTKEITALMSRNGAETYQLTQLNASLLARWSSKALDRKTKNKLIQLSKIKNDEFETQRQLQRLVEEKDNLQQSQIRVRANISAVNQGGDNQNAYIEKLNQIERQIDKNDAEQKIKTNALFNLTTSLNNIIRNF